MIELAPARSRRVWRNSAEAANDRHFDLRRSYPPKVMIWGCMSRRGLGSLAIIRGSMDTTKYLETLNAHLLPQAAAWFSSGDWTFQQDGARCHTSLRARQYFEDLQIPLLPWTANSPDLNPIENIWALLKRKVYKRGADTLDALIAIVQEVALDAEYWKPICENLIDSMPERVASVIRKKGGQTKY